MAVAKGVSVGPYEILACIGSGGMGEVWRARDQRIGRDVAIKVLPEFSDTVHDERIWRFEQEARAAGALNHPGLVTIFDVGTTDGSPYIVMELLEGETLRDALDIAGGPLPARKAIEYGAQIAAALSVAHEKGIIHRDLKPENLFITSDGRVKILDFGLAKLAAEASPNATRSTARHLTSAGIAVGTPGYMSPEQVRAQPLDHRTDIFSLGTVLYEMLTGRSIFERDSAIETMHAVLNAEAPPVGSLVEGIPPAVEAVVAHCMEKNPRDRFQAARDLAFQLRTLPDVPSNAITSRQPAPVEPKPRIRYRAAAAIAIALGLGTLGFALFRARGASAPRVFRQVTFGDGMEAFPTVAPDGKSFAYVSAQSGNQDIYVQRVDGRSAIDITADSPDDDSEPAFSPDGSQIAFRSEREGGGIFVMGVTGESVRRLTDFGHNPSWSPDGTRIVVSTAATDLNPHVHPNNGDLWIIDTRNGAKNAIFETSSSLATSDALQPSWSPHGDRIAFWGVSPQTAQRDVWTIDPDAPDPMRTVERVTSGGALYWNPVWSPDGEYLYFGSDRDGTLNLWRVSMDEGNGTPDGALEPLSLPAATAGNFAFSAQGEMAFVNVNRAYRLIALPFDAQTATTGAPRPLIGGTQEILTFQPSPDGQSIAYTTGGGAQEDVFIAEGTRVRQLTNDAAKDRSVTWSPDGRTIYFYSNRSGSYHIWSIHADGSGITRLTDDRELRRAGAHSAYAPNVSPDGRTVAVQTDRSSALLHLDRPAGQRLEAIGVNLASPKWTSDGQYLVGVDDTRTSTGARRGTVIVYSLRTKTAEVVRERGTAPQWLPNGRRIVFFERARIGVADLDTRQTVIAPFTPPPGVQNDMTTSSPRLSHDGTTLYMRQTVEQGDIWIGRVR